MKKIIRCFIVLLLLISGSSVYAWPDGNRQGLLMGLTSGIANAEFESGSDSKSGTGLMAGALIGAGINEQILMDFKFRYWNSEIDDITYHTWTWCADMMLFPVKDKGFFINGGIGRGLALPDVDNAEAKSGLFLYAGAGYEIVKWVSISADYAVGKFEDKIKSNTITLSLSATGY